MPIITLHRRPGGDPSELRIVPDGFRPSVFFFAPVALLARRLWLAFAAWLVLVIAIVALAVTGVLSPVAVVFAVLILHIAFAIDTPELERRRLAKRGWPIVAVSGPFGNAGANVASAGELPTTQASTYAPNAEPGVLGMFPSAVGPRAPKS